jgi:hypothetical protein
MKTTLIIPKLCKVGFNTREDTYSGRLGYVIYNDGKVWRKEKSWEGWIETYQDSEIFQKNKLEAFSNDVKRYTETYEKYKTDANWVKSYPTLEEYLKPAYVDKIENFRYYPGKVSDNKNIVPFEFNNEPLDGFVLNRKAGGAAGSSSSWNTRDVYCRVYDPRGFEIEISIPNLLYILENTNSIKGKGLEGKFCYAWDGKDLVLLPEDAPEFKEILQFTDMQKLKVSKKDLVLGGIYIGSDGIQRTYLGFSDYYDYNGFNEGKKHWWSTNCGHNSVPYIETKGLDSIKKFVSLDADYASKMDKLKDDKHYKIPDLEYVELTELDSLRPNNSSNWYSKKHTVYILEGKKYKKAGLELYSKYSSYKDELKIGRNEIEFKNNEILKTHKLWQLKTTNKS